MSENKEAKIKAEEMLDEDDYEEAEYMDEDEESEELSDDESGSDDGDRRSRKKFVLPPPRELPTRSTRGQRIGNLQQTMDEEADEEFWNQEFFAEEEGDERYETESEPEDRFDADFEESEESENEEDAEIAEEEARAMESKKKVLKPPGYKKSASKKIQNDALGKKESASVAKKARRTSSEPFIPPERTMSVRQSTRQRVQEAEEERRIMQTLKPKRVFKRTVHRQLTQDELLAEAARTEIENTKSLQYLVMVEEEARKKAEVKKARYAGPMIILRSSRRSLPSQGLEKQETDQPLDENDQRYCEITHLEVRNMQAPKWLQPQKSPAPLAKPVCVITGKPAHYRDPLTGLTYADKEAFRELRARTFAQMKNRRS